MSRYDDKDYFYDDRYDYDSIAKDCDDLYYDDIWDYEDTTEDSDSEEWENYYHNIADELVEE